VGLAVVLLGFGLAACEQGKGGDPMDALIAGQNPQPTLLIEVFESNDPATLILSVSDSDIEGFELVTDDIRPPHRVIRLQDPELLLSASAVVADSPFRDFKVRVVVAGAEVWGAVIPVASPEAGIGPLLTPGAMVGGGFPWDGDLQEDSLSLRSNGATIDGVGLVEAAQAAWQRSREGLQP